MSRKKKENYDELWNTAGSTPETYAVVKIVEAKPVKKGTSKSIPGPKRLTNIPKRGH